MIELLNIDCMEYMKTVPDKYFDLAVVDPPYRDVNEPDQYLRSHAGDMKKWLPAPLWGVRLTKTITMLR
jgi:DNA modification methylase